MFTALVTDLTVATWNLNCVGNEIRSARKIDFLERTDWDIACLQEVNEKASAALADHDDWSIVDGLQMVLPEVSGWRTPHGAVLVARNGWRLADGALVTNTPTPGRGVSAMASCDGCEVSVISWHAPNASGETAEVKMAGYRAVLAATYFRGKHSDVPDRFDYIMVSAELRVLDMTHDYDGADAAGSDHALVSATLALP